MVQSCADKVDGVDNCYHYYYFNFYVYVLFDKLYSVYDLNVLFDKLDSVDNLNVFLYIDNVQYQHVDNVFNCIMEV
ncbi:unnamed protein product [marine sediment metagenome]|uniref:Uncharacterized protein n=1 Tax=marine sediment metagenome TaxID=412755 RepID=X0V1T0_9ZZZZ